MGDDASTQVRLVMTPGHTPETGAVADVLSRFGTVGSPQFGDTDDPDLSRFFLVGVPERDASPLIAALLTLPEVDGAFTVPADEPA